MPKFQMFIFLFSTCLYVSGCSVTSNQISSVNQQAIRLVESEQVSDGNGNDLLRTSVDSRIPVTDGSMTLAEVLATPNVQSKFGIGPANELVVVVSEGSISRIFPMPLIGRKDIGKILVSSRSSVQILTYEQWSNDHPIYAFTTASDGAGQTDFPGPAEFVLSGLVETPGVVAIPKLADVKKVNKYRLGKLAHLQSLESLVKPDVAVVSRIRQGRVLKHFVPLTLAGTGDFEKYFVQDGDSVQVTRIELLPEVIAGKAAERMRSRLAAESENASSTKRRLRLFRR